MKEPEVKNNLVTTLNQRGYMLGKPEYIMQSFIDCSAALSDPVLDIGAAYGVATIPALKRGACVVANDMDARHLEILKSKVPSSLLENLKLNIGKMPHDLDFSENYFGAILASRILSFVDPHLLGHSFSLVYKWLKPGGKLFYLGPTPYTGSFSSFLPTYTERKKENFPWPGYVDDIQLHAPKHAHQLPHFINLIDEDILKRLVSNAGFQILEMTYTPGDEECPEEMKIDSRNFLGAIAVKPPL
jgi:SAM-dependent methyltransferase